MAHNDIAHRHDGVDVVTCGHPAGAPNDSADRVPVSIDFYNNDIFNMGDNCLKSDVGARNTACSGIAASPPRRSLERAADVRRPVYVYQNVVYNAPASGSMKFVAMPAGVLCCQDTFVGDVIARGPASNAHFRNNLVLARGGGDPVFALNTCTSYSSSDYTGFRQNPDVATWFESSSSPFDTRADDSRATAPRRFADTATRPARTGTA